jgi:MoxR-like ATPase
MMHISVDYPDEKAEQEIVRLVRSEKDQIKKAPAKKQEPMPQETIFKARGEIDKIIVPPHVLKYIVDFVFITRYPERINYELKSYISIGASPRASIALDKTTRTLAWLRGEKEVTTDHVRTMVKSVLRHRIKLSDRALKNKVTSDDLINDILEKLPVPSES